MALEKKNRLGKGLGALLGEYLPEDGGTPAGELRRVPVARIAPNPFQPRHDFAEQDLDELAASIAQEGLLQPLVVRPAGESAPEGAEWELIAGERRWRAVRRLGWAEVPAVVKLADDQAMLVLAIVENIQRAKLSPLEEAAGYKRLVEEFGYTQAAVAERVHKDRTTITNLLRLLQLPASVQHLIDDGQLSMGHARALLGLETERAMAELAREVVEKQLPVRAVEERVRQAREAREARAKGAEPARSAERDRPRDPHLRHLETELQRALGTAVRIRVARGQSGKIEIPFYNPGDFERVMELLLGTEASRA